MIATGAIRRLETFRLPDELLGAVPRDVRLTGGGIALAVIAVAMAIGALVGAILLSVTYTRADGERQLREREGVTVQADVVQVALRRGEHPSWIVTYRYDVDGRSYTGRAALGQSDQRDITRGGTIPVRYVRSKPETSWMSGYEPNVIPLWVIPLVAASSLAGAAGIAWALRRQWILLSEGRVAQARITDQKKVHSGKHTAYRVSYQFQALSGATYVARYEAQKSPSPVGTMIPIVYHRDQPRWSAAYPFQLVRPSRARPHFSFTTRAGSTRTTV